ncbi:MAG: tetratricopeptide repeat protein [Anaerolineales bacterium]|nr:tetratricopeptide repeat protein [Anaerolineales bacterium]
MYLHTSKYKIKRKKPSRFNLALIFTLCLLIVGAAIVQAYVVPRVPPLFLPTPTATRPAASYAEDAAAMFMEGKLESSIALYQQSILLAPTNSELYVALSRVQVFAHDYQGAVENAQYAVLLSKSAMSYAVWGEAIHRLEAENDLPAYENAVKQLRKSLELEPNLALAHAYLAEVLMDTDWQYYEDASAAARTAIVQKPDLMESHRAMGYVYLMTGNYSEALDEYQKAIDLHNKLADLWLRLGQCYQAVNDPGEAIDAYLKASTLDSKSPDPFVFISRTYAGQGEFGKAAQYAEMAVALAPLNPSYHGLLGVMYYRNRRYQEAIPELSLAIAGGTINTGTETGTVVGLPLGDWPVSEYYWTYGLALAKVGRCAEAIPVFRLLEQQRPDDEIAMENVAEGLTLCKADTPQPSA